jgi:ferredoxin
MQMKYDIEKCGYCGACVSVCPNDVLELTECEIIVNAKCEDCGICTVVCPLGALVLEGEK